jgi:hypothetical protein
MDGPLVAADQVERMAFDDRRRHVEEAVPC